MFSGNSGNSVALFISCEVEATVCCYQHASFIHSSKSCMDKCFQPSLINCQFAIFRERSNKRRLKETIGYFTLVCRNLAGTEYAQATAPSPYFWALHFFTWQCKYTMIYCMCFLLHFGIDIKVHQHICSQMYANILYTSTVLIYGYSWNHSDSAV